eukprot:TRINITY_DN67741_c12_g1_i2.p2 TRINITY_DN67741_c12_g1~~TRINITY_DN67741_c12_g1_i2.p2  ORF type:complete len:195 (-),score=15.11 TRINITY_DN67741_c12_g1_i2:123-707(-)
MRSFSLSSVLDSRMLVALLAGELNALLREDDLWSPVCTLGTKEVLSEDFVNVEGEGFDLYALLSANEGEKPSLRELELGVGEGDVNLRVVVVLVDDEDDGLFNALFNADMFTELEVSRVRGGGECTNLGEAKSGTSPPPALSRAERRERGDMVCGEPGSPVPSSQNAEGEDGEENETSCAKCCDDVLVTGFNFS